MSLLLRPQSTEQIARDPTNTSHFGVATPTQSFSFSPTVHASQRDRVRTSIFERKYKQIMDARLSHLPVRLPFPRAELIKKLKENDRSASNWRAQQKLLDIETEMFFLQGSISAPKKQAKPQVAARTRRLSDIWEYLSLSAQRAQNLFDGRVGRLNFNINVFFKSDLPSQYLLDIGESTQWELAALSTVGNAEAECLMQRLCKVEASKVRKQDFLRVDASFRDIEKFYREYLSRFRKITGMSDVVLEWRDALEYYVDLFSADTLEAFRTLRPITVKTLDSGVLNYLSTGLHGAMDELRRTLIEEYPSEVQAYSFVPPGDQFVTEVLVSELGAS